MEAFKMKCEAPFLYAVNREKLLIDMFFLITFAPVSFLVYGFCS